MPFWWMLYGMTQCLLFALACNLEHIFAIFWFLEQICDDITIYSTVSFSSIQKEIYKKWHADARLLAIWHTLVWCLSYGYTTKFLRLGTPGNTTQAEISWFWWPRYNPTYWVMQKCCVNAFMTHVLWTYDLDVCFDGNIHFLTSDLVWGQCQVKVTVRSNKVKSANTKF